MGKLVRVTINEDKRLDIQGVNYERDNRTKYQYNRNGHK